MKNCSEFHLQALKIILGLKPSSTSNERKSFIDQLVFNPYPTAYERTCVFSKQWPLAGEFSKFEYSPKICRFFVTRAGEFVEY
jgi:hypothetical protein